MHDFDWGFDMIVLGLIYKMRDKRKRKPAKKVDVLNRAAYIGMDRDKVVQAINELGQMGEIIETRGGDADWDRLRVVNEKRISRYRREELLNDPYEIRRLKRLCRE